MLLANITVATGQGSYYVNEKVLLNEYKEVDSKILRSKQKIFDNKELAIESRLIEDEYPYEYINRIIKEEQFDLVVIGIKGSHSKIREVIIGSIAQKVVKNTPCDVLVIK